MFFVLDGGGAALAARALIPSPMGLRSASVEIDLERVYEVSSERQVPRSPLELLLGVDGSAGRDLALCVFAAGLDWATSATEDLGTRVRGSDARTVVRAALEARGQDLHALRHAAGAWLGPEELEDDELFSACGDLERLMVGTEVLPSVSNGSLVAAYRSDDLFALAAVEVTLRRTLDHRMNLCAHCSCLFVPVERIDEHYCRRAAPGEPVGGRGCHQLGPQRRYDATHVDDLRAAYRRAYKRLDARARRSQITREALSLWREEARLLVARGEARHWGIPRFERELLAIEPKGD